MQARFARKTSSEPLRTMTVANPSSFPRLMGDVGGTNARFAVQEDRKSVV